MSLKYTVIFLGFCSLIYLVTELEDDRILYKTVAIFFMLILCMIADEIKNIRE